MRRRRRLAPFSLIIIIIIRYSLFLILNLTTIFFFSFFRLSHTSRFPLFIQCNRRRRFFFSSSRVLFPIGLFLLFLSACVCCWSGFHCWTRKHWPPLASTKSGPQKHRRSIDVLYSIPHDGGGQRWRRQGVASSRPKSTHAQPTCRHCADCCCCNAEWRRQAPSLQQQRFAYTHLFSFSSP